MLGQQFYLSPVVTTNRLVGRSRFHDLLHFCHSLTEAHCLHPAELSKSNIAIALRNYDRGRVVLGIVALDEPVQLGSIELGSSGSKGPRQKRRSGRTKAQHMCVAYVGAGQLLHLNCGAAARLEARV